MNHIKEISTSLTIISEMLTDRGKTATNLNRLSVAEVTSIVNSRNMFSVSTAEDTIIVVYDMSPKFKWATSKQYIESLIDIDSGLPKLVILVVKEESDIKNIKGGLLADTEMQVFYLKELQFNKTTHVLVPKHEIITDAAYIAAILESCSLTKASLLPLILKTDPQVKYLNAHSGDVIKVTRISPTCGENIVYRYVT